MSNEDSIEWRRERDPRGRRGAGPPLPGRKKTGAPACGGFGPFMSGRDYFVAIMNSFSPVGYWVTPVISGMAIQVVA